MFLIFSLIQYVAAFVLGVLVTVMLSCAGGKIRSAGGMVLICVVLLCVQLVSFWVFGLSVTKKLYPVLVHISLWGLLVVLLKTPKLQTAVSVLVAYLCCQPPRWVASLGLLIPENHWLYPVLYLPVAGLFLLFLRRYLVVPIRRLLGQSRKNCLLMGLVPALYYVFDYVTTVYTSLLTSGNMAAVQFMPSVASMAYLAFVILYHIEQEKQTALSRERDLLETQLNQSKITFAAMQQSQEKTRQYRHDMRHHFAMLQAFAAENNLEKIQQYLNTVQQDIEALLPMRFCGNDVVNLLLSYYTSVARTKGVELVITAVLPAELSYSDTELCSLLSNGLENAIDAASRVDEAKERCVTVRMGIHGENLLIQIENPFAGEIFWQDGLPCAHQEEHGLGTQSIRSVVRSHGGEAIFRGENGFFQLRMLLPNSGMHG